MNVKFIAQCHPHRPALMVIALAASALLLPLSAGGATTGAAASAQFPNVHIRNATAVGEVFAEGEKITAVILEYDQPIDSGKLSAASFTVKDRKITRVYANSSASKAARGVDGRFVVLELDPLDVESDILGGQRDRASGVGGQGGAGGPGGPGGAGAAGAAGQRPARQGNGQMPGGGGTRKPVQLTVTQVADIAAAGGAKIASDATPFVTNLAKNLIIDDFQQLNFKDPVTGTAVMYNLYVPKSYDKTKSYPLVLFMHDASVNSAEHDRTLIQGLGAVVWASPADQTKHAAFVLAPQFNGGGDTTDLAYRLVNDVVARYSIDRNRLYTTGQSAGCTTSLKLDIKYPDLFAASMFVAGQEDPQATAVLMNKKMWIVVSEGDYRAFPGMNDSIAVWEKAGARVVKDQWSAREPADAQAAKVARMAAQHNNIMYTTFAKGTTLPVGMEDSGASEHLMSMRYAYSLPGIRDWLFQQSKTPGP